MAEKKKAAEHRDYFDRELAVNDCVVYSRQNLFQVGRIVRLGEKMILVQGYDHARKNWRTGVVRADRKYGDEVLKVDEREVTMYLLRRQPA